MRSTSSPRAVSNKIGSREVARPRRSTSNPLMPGSITSKTTSRYPPPVAFCKPLSPSCTHSTMKPSACKYSTTKWQSSTSSSMTRIRSIFAAFIVHPLDVGSCKELSNLHLDDVTKLYSGLLTLYHHPPGGCVLICVTRSLYADQCTQKSRLSK